MNDALTALLGIALIAIGVGGIVLLQRSVMRVDTANTADPEQGGLHVFNAAARWFGIALIGGPTLLALMFGVAMIMGSLGLGPLTSPIP